MSGQLGTHFGVGGRGQQVGAVAVGGEPPQCGLLLDGFAGRTIVAVPARPALVCGTYQVPAGLPDVAEHHNAQVVIGSIGLVGSCAANIGDGEQPGLSLFRFDGHHPCGGQAARAAS
ncbi:hypothetical protein ACFU93_40930 [Streptomyces sp. NPDC057611]|uniref:hypothetical protein n=1 Tax=Streptomyces sp. NPDC057611 TaxID=3346182 RepID=UPI00368419E4